MGGVVRIVQEMEKPENLHLRPMDMNMGGGCWREEWSRAEREKGKKKWDNCNSIINKIYLKIMFIHFHLI